MAYRLSMTIKLYWKVYFVDISDIFIDFIGFILKAINFKKINKVARWYYALQYCINNYMQINYHTKDHGLEVVQPFE